LDAKNTSIANTAEILIEDINAFVDTHPSLLTGENKNTIGQFYTKSHLLIADMAQEKAFVTGIQNEWPPADFMHTYGEDFKKQVADIFLRKGKLSDKAALDVQNANRNLKEIIATNKGKG